MPQKPCDRLLPNLFKHHAGKRIAFPACVRLACVNHHKAVGMQAQLPQLSPRSAQHARDADIIADLKQANQFLHSQLQQLSPRPAQHGQEADIIADLKQANQSLHSQLQQLSPRPAQHGQEADIIADLKQANQSLHSQLHQLSQAAADHRQESDLIAALERANQSLELHCQANNSLIDELKVHNQQLADELAHAKHQAHDEADQPDVQYKQMNRQLQL